MSAIRVAVVNKSTRSNGEVRKVTEALRKQLRSDFGPAWSIDADIEFFEARCRERAPGSEHELLKTHVPIGWWWLVIQDGPRGAGDPNRSPEVSGLSLLDGGQRLQEHTRKLGLVLGEYQRSARGSAHHPVAATLGRHTVSERGLPVAVVYADVADAVFDGVPGVAGEVGGAWAGTASHELLEMLANPWNNRAISHPGEGNVLAFYALEVCDPCQRSRYPIHGVNVAAFVRPSFFEPKPESKHSLAYGAELTSPFTPQDGGFIGVYQVTSNRGWQLLTARGLVDRSNEPKPLHYGAPGTPVPGTEPDIESIVAP